MPDYTLRSLDDLLRWPPVAGRRLALYRSVLTPKTQAARRTFLPLDPYNLGLAAQFDAVLGWTPPLRAGLLDLHGFDFVGEWALPCHPGAGVCVLDAALGWNRQHLQEFASPALRERSGFALSRNGRLLCMSDAVVELEEALVLSCPGQHIYGHWIIDFLMRLLTVRQSGGWPGKVLLNVAPDFCAAFLRSFGIDNHQIVSLAGHGAVRIGRAVIPTLAKIDAHIAYPLLRQAGEAFRTALRSIPLPDAPARPLPQGRHFFLDRAGPSTRMRAPLIANMPALREVAAAAGFVVLQPERHTVREQALLFEQARVLVGEDGSALHNAVFCDPGCVVGVISEAERFSPLHASLCHQMGHVVAYIRGRPGPDGKERIDAAEFRRFLGALLAD